MSETVGGRGGPPGAVPVGVADGPRPEAGPGPAEWERYGRQPPRPESAGEAWSSPGATPAKPGPSPLGVDPEIVGNADVDSVLQRLGEADRLPTESHIEVYEEVHGALQDILNALDSRPGPPLPSLPPQSHSAANRS